MGQGVLAGQGQLHIPRVERAPEPALQPDAGCLIRQRNQADAPGVVPPRHQHLQRSLDRHLKGSLVSGKKGKSGRALQIRVGNLPQPAEVEAQRRFCVEPNSRQTPALDRIVLNKFQHGRDQASIATLPFRPPQLRCRPTTA
jgi:hypothetical protein